MNTDFDDELLDPAIFQSVTGKHISSIDKFPLYLIIEGWFYGSFYDGPEVLLNVNGYFDVRIDSYEIQRSHGLADVELYVLRGDLNSDANHDGDPVALPREKRNQLGMHEDSSAWDLDFTFRIDVPVGIGVSSKGLYLSWLELLYFCESEGFLTPDLIIRKAVDKFGAKVCEIDSEDLLSVTSQSLLDAIEANEQFWSTYDPNNSKTIPKQAEIIKWLRDEKGHTQNMAEAIAKVVNGGRSHSGGRPRSTESR